ncbi:MAG: hypothetical protein AB1791_10650 [Chloroflexota bacterium]
MSEEINPTDSGEVTSDDHLWAALAYVFTPIVPIILLLMEDKKNRPFIKAHNMQALIWGVVLYVITAVTAPFLLGCILGPLGLLITLYWAYQAYQGQMVTIPVLTDFAKNQGWA